ncbi:phenylalanine--tRNA ligase subunit beta [Patescibacteria group bacterium]|nr:phenylalanine--tRNA ligase subunit beta [Patescibacteria group bacterium]
MNILIPHSWLLEYLETKAPPKKLAECLSLCGPSFESVNRVGADWIYDIEVTTNRVDLMSVMGIAREAAAILPQFGIKARFKPPVLPEITKSNQFKINLTDSNRLCQRIMAVVIDNINLGPSPEKIRRRLEATGMRALNNTIDVTNYVMREIGQPTHVFDYDRLKSKQLILRLSKPGEKIVSLENKSYKLPGGDIVIDDGSGEIIDLPGIIGTANSVITPKTKRALLFLETNDPIKMRQTSMTLGIRTDAATLNEKGVDPELAPIALKRAVQLIKELTGGQVASRVYDIYHKPLKTKTINTPLQLIKERLGIDISNKKITSILAPLGLKSQSQSKDKLLIAIPSWRHKDINISEDIVEEVARIYGYHRLPSEIMATPIPTNYPDENFVLEHQIKTWLAGMGLMELYTNSLINQPLAKMSQFKVTDHLKIKNALSADWLYLRRSLIPSHWQAIKNNPDGKLQFFEIAHVYHPKKNALPQEELQLIISSNQDYLSLKGIVEALLNKLHLEFTFQPQPNQWAKITLGKKTLGEIKTLDQNWVAVLSLKPLLQLSRRYPRYQAISKHPAIIEDLTFTLSEQTYIAPVIATIKKADRLIQQVRLAKVFKPANGAGRHNYTFTLTYQSRRQSLKTTEIAPVRKKIVSRLANKYAAQLVGKI